MKIKVFSDFCTSEECKKRFEKTYKCREDIITCDDDYTHAIILNKAMPELKVPAKNVLGLACEPNEFLNLDPIFISYAEKNIGKYFIGNIENLQPPFIEHHGYLWFDHPIEKKIVKTKKMSIVFSKKKNSPGHKYRHILVENILSKGLDVDIYGYGCNHLTNKNKNVKGEFINTEPYENYMFTICIENFKTNAYFSEKIMTPIMCDTIPIYFGCDNIENYVDDFCIKMTGILHFDLVLVEEILKNPFNFRERIKTKKEHIFERVNLMEDIQTIFS